MDDEEGVEGCFEWWGEAAGMCGVELASAFNDADHELLGF